MTWTPPDDIAFLLILACVVLFLLVIVPLATWLVMDLYRAVRWRIKRVLIKRDQAAYLKRRYGKVV